MSLITVGTMAFDAIETPFGKVDKIVGGSATYVAYAASNFVSPVQQISIVGYDFPEEEMKSLQKRGVQTEGVEVVKDKKSFFWSGKYHIDMNSRDTLITDLHDFRRKGLWRRGPEAMAGRGIAGKPVVLPRGPAGRSADADDCGRDDAGKADVATA